MRKRHYYYLIVLSLFSFHLFGQNEWAPIGATWYYNKLEGFAPPNMGYVKIECVKDSILESKTVRVLQKTYYTSLGDTISWGNDYTYYDNDIVYYWTGSSFQVLYNFSANNNDTWMVFSNDYNPCGSDSFGIVEVDSSGQELINDVNLKYLYVSPDDTSIWGFNKKKIIQVIGSTDYMFPVPKSCGVMDFFNVAGPLRCYKDNLLGTVNFLNLDCDTLIDLTTGIKNNIKHEVTIYPVPSDDVLFIEVSDVNIVELQLFNSLGNLIQFHEGFRKSYEIHLASNPPGIYLLKIKDENRNVYVKKILKN